MTDIFEKIKKILIDHLDIEENKIDMNSSFVDDLGADSLDIVELIMAFEEQFEVEITDEEAQELLTIKNVIDLINSKVSQREEI